MGGDKAFSPGGFRKAVILGERHDWPGCLENPGNLGIGKNSKRGGFDDFPAMKPSHIRFDQAQIVSRRRDHHDFKKLMRGLGSETAHGLSNDLIASRRHDDDGHCRGIGAAHLSRSSLSRTLEVGTLGSVGNL
jgi:hypothetical protein